MTREDPRPYLATDHLGGSAGGRDVDTGWHVGASGGYWQCGCGAYVPTNTTHQCTSQPRPPASRPADRTSESQPAEWNDYKLKFGADAVVNHEWTVVEGGYLFRPVTVTHDDPCATHGITGDCASVFAKRDRRDFDGYGGLGVHSTVGVRGPLQHVQRALGRLWHGTVNSHLLRAAVARLRGICGKPGRGGTQDFRGQR
jgi:hypothetical protein